MIWREHSTIRGQHAFLSPSKYSWINYDNDKLAESYMRAMASQRGVELHAWAAQTIKLNQKLPRSSKTLNMYINDAIGYRMRPEQELYYSPLCFGTADAITFKEKSGQLRIHDLKTGLTPAHMEQLLIYSALFCLEYGIRPGDIETELRIYQSDDVLVSNPTAEEIGPVMDRIVTFDRIINDIRKEEQP